MFNYKEISVYFISFIIGFSDFSIKLITYIDDYFLAHHFYFPLFINHPHITFIINRSFCPLGHLYYYIFKHQLHGSLLTHTKNQSHILPQL